MSGIRVLSDWNTKIFFLMALFVLVFGPTTEIFINSGKAILGYVTDVLPRTALVGNFSTDIKWANSWTIFYWAVWMAWAPVTALFLGKISRGYTVREFIFFNLIFPALFSIIWMSISVSYTHLTLPTIYSV